MDEKPTFRTPYDGATKRQRTAVDAWLTANGYTDIGEWLADSDYQLGPDNEWFTEEGHRVDPYTQAWFAREVADDNTATRNDVATCAGD